MSGLMDVFDADDSAAGHDARSMHFLKVAQNPRPRRTSFSLADPETMVAASKPRWLLRRTIPAAGLLTISLEFRDRHFDNNLTIARPDPVNPAKFFGSESSAWRFRAYLGKPAARPAAGLSLKLKGVVVFFHDRPCTDNMPGVICPPAPPRPERRGAPFQTRPGRTMTAYARRFTR